MKFVYSDGGRISAGFKSESARDCVCRSISIASGIPYSEIYGRLSHGNHTQIKTKKSSNNSGKKTASAGINTNRKWFKDYMKELGFSWVPTMKIGSGCKIHLRDGELPTGRLVVSLSRHFTAVIDGTIYDTHDPSRNGSRCVYRYYILKHATVRS